MARAYTVATVAVALGVEPKWVDNVLSHYLVPGVPRQKQGIARRLSADAVVTLALTLRLAEDLGIPVARGVELARKLINGRGTFTGQAGISISVDLDLAADLAAERLAAAVEVAPVPRRGRPPQNKTGRLE